MTKIELPNKTNSNDVKIDDKKDDEVAGKPADEVMTKMGSLLDEMGEANKARRDKDAADKAATEEDEIAKLAAEADLKALMESGDDEEAPETSKTRKQQVDDMTNSEVIDLVGTAVETAIGARMEQATKDVEKKFKTTAGAMSKIIELLGKMQASAGMERIRGKYPDFDTFKDDTLKVLDKYPMMDIEDAHLLARKLREGDSVPASQTSFERPGMPFDRGQEPPRASKEEESERGGTPKSGETHGIVGFRDIIGKALDKKYGS